MSALSDILYERHKSPIFGIRLTKHFFERLEQRKKIESLGSILTHLNKNLCIIMFEVALTDELNKVYNISGVSIPIMLSTLKYPKLIIKTVY